MFAAIEKNISTCTGLGVSILCLALLLTRWGDPVTGVASVFLAVICITDSLWMRIPNLLPVAMLITAVGYLVSTSGVSGLLTALYGFAAGFAIFLLPYSFGWIGGGDLKASAALGALIGPSAIFKTALLGTLAGGVLGIIFIIVNNLSKEKMTGLYQTVGVAALTRQFSQVKSIDGMKTKFAYAPALAIGYVAMVMLG